MLLRRLRTTSLYSRQVSVVHLCWCSLQESFCSQLFTFFNLFFVFIRQGFLKGEPTSHCRDILIELREEGGGGRNMLKGGGRIRCIIDSQSLMYFSSILEQKNHVFSKLVWFDLCPDYYIVLVPPMPSLLFTDIQCD